MLTNEATTNANPPTIWSVMGSDLKSPIYRLYRLQSLLSVISSSLRREGDTALESIEIQHLERVADWARQESEDIADDFENYLCDVTYLSSAKTSAL